MHRHAAPSRGGMAGLLVGVVAIATAMAPGASAAPFARSMPWELPAYDFSASPWHFPQVTFFSFSCGALASVWQVTQEPDGVKSLFVDASGKLLGYALNGKATAERAKLTPLLPPVLP